MKKLLKLTAKATVKSDYSPKFAKGGIVSIDAIKPRAHCASGYMVRVIGIWKEPRWFDAHWFEELTP